MRGGGDGALRNTDPGARQPVSKWTAQAGVLLPPGPSGDRRAFVERIRAGYPSYFSSAPSLAGADLDAALLAAQALGESGLIEARMELLGAIEESIRTPRASQYLWLAAVHAMRGETDAAMQQLMASPPGRVRERAEILLRDPRFASLREEPEFQALVARHLEALHVQAEKAEADDAMG